LTEGGKPLSSFFALGLSGENVYVSLTLSGT
jgi:hypothetical protein